MSTSDKVHGMDGGSKQGDTSEAMTDATEDTGTGSDAAASASKQHNMDGGEKTAADRAESNEAD